MFPPLKSQKEIRRDERTRYFLLLLKDLAGAASIFIILWALLLLIPAIGG